MPLRTIRYDSRQTKMSLIETVRGLFPVDYQQEKYLTAAATTTAIPRTVESSPTLD